MATRTHTLIETTQTAPTTGRSRQHRPTCQACGIGLERATHLGWDFPSLCVGCLAMLESIADEDEALTCPSCGQQAADCRANGCWQWAAAR